MQGVSTLTSTALSITRFLSHSVVLVNCRLRGSITKYSHTLSVITAIFSIFFKELSTNVQTKIKTASILLTKVINNVYVNKIYNKILAN